MYLLTSGNKPLIETILYISKSVINKADKSNSKIKNDSIINKDLGISILNTYYSKLFRKLQDGSTEVKGIIRPVTNSVLTLIDYQSVGESHLEFNYPLASSTTIEAITKKLNTEISRYVYTYLPKVKTYGYKVDAYIKKMDKSISINDNFELDILEFTDLKEMVVEKELLNKYIIPTNDVNPKIDTLELNKDVTNIELNLLMKDLLETLSKDNDVYHFLNTVVNSDDSNFTIEEIYNVSSSLNYYNALVYLLVLIHDIIKNGDDLPNDYLINYKRIYNVLVGEIVNNNSIIDRARVVDHLIYSIIKQNDTYTVTVFGDTYKKYMQDNNPGKAIYGYVLNNYMNDPVNVSLIKLVTMDKVIHTKDENIKAVDKHISIKQLEYKNNLRETVTTYWLMALSVVITDKQSDMFYKDIEEYLNTLSLIELNNTKDTALNIFKNIIYKDSNFDIFVNGYSEAIEITKSDDKDLYVTYAAYKLVLLYLAQQTNVY